MPNRPKLGTWYDDIEPAVNVAGWKKCGNSYTEIIPFVRIVIILPWKVALGLESEVLKTWSITLLFKSSSWSTWVAQ